MIWVITIVRRRIPINYLLRVHISFHDFEHKRKNLEAHKGLYISLGDKKGLHFGCSGAFLSFLDWYTLPSLFAHTFPHSPPVSRISQEILYNLLQKWWKNRKVFIKSPLKFKIWLILKVILKDEFHFLPIFWFHAHLHAHLGGGISVEQTCPSSASTEGFFALAIQTGATVCPW